jgi:hypothetical protein
MTNISTQKNIEKYNATMKQSELLDDNFLYINKEASGGYSAYILQFTRIQTARPLRSNTKLSILQMEG